MNAIGEDLERRRRHARATNSSSKYSAYSAASSPSFFRRHWLVILLVVAACGFALVPFFSFSSSDATSRHRMRASSLLRGGDEAIDVVVDPSKLRDNAVSLIVAIRGGLPAPAFFNTLSRLETKQTDVEVIFSFAADNPNVTQELLMARIKSVLDHRRLIASHQQHQQHHVADNGIFDLLSRSKFVRARKRKNVVAPPGVLPLGQLYVQATEVARAESKFLLFLTSFVDINSDPRNFVVDLLREIRATANSSASGNGDSDNDDDAAATAATTSRLGAVQCLVFDKSSPRRPDVARSTPLVVADAGWAVDIGSASASQNHYQDETLYLANREAGTPVSAGRFFKWDHHHDDGGGGEPALSNVSAKLLLRPPHVVDLISVSTCALVDRALFHSRRVGGFGGPATEMPTDADILQSTASFGMVRRREGAERELFESIVAVETIVESMTMDDVRRASYALRRQVRDGYAAVTDAISLFESVSHRGMAAERQRVVHSMKFPGRYQPQQQQQQQPHPSTTTKTKLKQTKKSTTTTKTKMKRKKISSSTNNHEQVGDEEESDDPVWRLMHHPCMRKHSLEDRLRCACDRLVLAGRVARTMAAYVVPTVPEHLMGWLLSIKLRAASPSNPIRVAVSSRVFVVADFAASAPDDDVAAAVAEKALATSQLVVGVPELEPWQSFLRSWHPEFARAMSVTFPKSEQQQQQQRKTSDDDAAAAATVVVPVVRPRRDAVFLRVVWFAICCGCCGFSAEIAHFVKPLSEKYPISLVPGPKCFCPGQPIGLTEMLARQNIHINQYALEHLFARERLIWIAHTDPQAFVQGGFFVRRRPAYVVGRTMYEFSRLPVAWDKHVTDADELWVPSRFVRDLFLRSDVGLDAERVLVIPEGIDTRFFSPRAHEAASALRFTHDNAPDAGLGVGGGDVAARWPNVFCNRDSFWSEAYESNEELLKSGHAVDEERDGYFVDDDWNATTASDPDPDSDSSPRKHRRRRSRFSNKPWRRADFVADIQRNNNSFYNKRTRTAPDPYVFFSNFKWEPRKGWEFLFESYFRSFYETQSEEDTTLLVLSYVFYAHGAPKDWSVFNVSYMLEQLHGAFSEQFPGKQLHEMPRFCIVAESVSEFELAQFFRGADAFVLPTRGEGWGLPTMQAMSMALPTISTNWGGSVDFMTPETSFLIDVDAIEEVPLDSEYGHRPGKKWATPSGEHLQQLMRYVHDNRDHARRVGERAREHIVKRFDDYVVTKILDRRLQEIREMLS